MLTKRRTKWKQTPCKRQQMEKIRHEIKKSTKMAKTRVSIIIVVIVFAAAAAAAAAALIRSGSVLNVPFEIWL